MMNEFFINLYEDEAADAASCDDTCYNDCNYCDTNCDTSCYGCDWNCDMYN